MTYQLFFVEANKKLKPFIDENLKNYNKVRCEYVALGNKDSKVFLNLNFQILIMMILVVFISFTTIITPPIGTNKIEVEMTTADKLLREDDVDFLSIDVQGYELEVLKGSKKILNQVNYVISEVNRTEQYKGCALVNELDEYLNGFGFL